jgi:hypothetical protein
MAELKKIVVPEPLHIRLDGNLTDYQFADFVAYLLNTQEYFNQTGVGIRAATRIEGKIRKQIELASNEDTKTSEEATTILLDEEDWKALKEAAEKPSAGYVLKPSRVMLPFIDAISNATSG